MMKLFAFLLSIFGLTSCQADTIPTLAPIEFLQTMKADTTATLLDVRQPAEYLDGHLEGATNLDFLNTAAFEEGIKKLDPSRTYYIYCRSGRRSHAAAEKMTALGLKVVDMKGGILAWLDQKLPVIK